METPQTKSELKTQMRGHRRSILDALRFYNGRANSKQIGDYSGVPSGSKHHHLGLLTEWEVLEKNGAESIGKGGEAYVYKLTSIGEELADELAKDRTTVDDLEALQDDIDDVKRDVTRLRDSFNELATVVEKLANE